MAHERIYNYEGMTIEDMAKMEGKHPLDASLDLDEELETNFSHSGGPRRGSA